MSDFPGAIASDGSLLIAANNVSSTLNGGISAVAVSATLASTVNFPAKGGITIETEAILYTSNNTATSVLSGLTRGVDSTTAAVHADGTSVYMHNQARHHNATKDEVIAIETNIANRIGNTTTGISLSGITQISSTSYFIGNATNGIRFNDSADSKNAVIINDQTLTVNNIANFNTTTTFNSITRMLGTTIMTGRINQIVLANATAATTTTSGTYQTTGLSGALTTATTTSKVLVIATQSMTGNTTTSTGGFRVLRGSTNISPAGDTLAVSGINYEYATVAIFDTPNTTGSVTYSTVFGNGIVSGSTNITAQPVFNAFTMPSTLILVEVLQ